MTHAPTFLWIGVLAVDNNVHAKITSPVQPDPSALMAQYLANLQTAGDQKAEVARALQPGPRDVSPFSVRAAELLSDTAFTTALTELQAKVEACVLLSR